jgi:hypothetical protein
MTATYGGAQSWLPESSLSELGARREICSACQTPWCNCCHWTCGGEPVQVHSLEQRVAMLEDLNRKLLEFVGTQALRKRQQRGLFGL